MSSETFGGNGQGRAGESETSCCKTAPAAEKRVSPDCCGGPVPDTLDACCRDDAEAKAAGASGCGCGSSRNTASRAS